MQPGPSTVTVASAEHLLEDGLAALDDLARDPTPRLRWYRAAAPSVVLGRGRRPRLVPVGVPVVARGSGGGAVWMDEDLLCLDIVLPAGHPLLRGDVAGVFLPVGDAWRAALEELGVANLTVHRGPLGARLRGDERERLVAAICYATAGRGEVLAAGRKLVGLAQRRRREGALVQCGLLRRWRPERLLRALGAEEVAEDVRHAAVGLDELLAEPPAEKEIVRVVEAHLSGYIERR